MWDYLVPFSGDGYMTIPIIYNQGPLLVTATLAYNDRQWQGSDPRILSVSQSTTNSKVADGDVAVFFSPSSWTIKRLGDVVTFNTYVKGRTIATCYNISVKSQVTSNLLMVSTNPTTTVDSTSASWSFPSITNQQTVIFGGVSKVVAPSCISQVNATVQLGCAGIIKTYQLQSSQFSYVSGIINLGWDLPITGTLCQSVS